MAEIGKICDLKVIKELEFGLILDGEQLGNILLPKRYVPAGSKIGDIIEVFIYKDSEGRLIATSQRPYAAVGEFALMKTVAVDKIGAFLDWGIQKDLLVPFREQKERMEEGKSYVVFVYLDMRSDRICASTKLGKYLEGSPDDYAVGQEVDLLVYDMTELGYNVIINSNYKGILYKSEVFQSLEIGARIKGYIKKIRTDGKIDCSLQKQGYESARDFSEVVLDKLKDEGFIPLSDDSSPEMIYDMFGVSKKTFKKAIGALYKKRIITIEDKGIRLNTIEE